MIQPRQWIENKLNEFEGDYKKVQKECFEEYCEIYVEIKQKCFEDKVRKVWKTWVTDNDFDDGTVDDIIHQGIKLKTQNLQDKNTFLRRENRNLYRNVGFLEEVYDNLNKSISDVKFGYKAKKFEVKPEDRTAIVCLSDLHLNTLVTEAEADNEYNFDIASKRLQKYITKTKAILKDNHVKNVIVANLGDSISSSRRFDEKLAQISSLTTATLLAVHLIQQVICDLNQDFNVSVTGVIGNESRINQDDFNFGAINCAENWDWLILTMLKKIFEKNPEINFMIPRNPIKALIPVTLANGEIFNVMIAHGNLIKKPIEGAETIYTKEYLENGTFVNLCLFGHFHHCVSFGKAVYTGTMMGGNSYSASLGCTTSAIQNVIILNNDKTFWALPINLDEVEGFDGYEYEKELEPFAYLIHQQKDIKQVNITLF